LVDFLFSSDNGVNKSVFTFSGQICAEIFDIQLFLFLFFGSGGGTVAVDILFSIQSDFAFDAVEKFLEAIQIVVNVDVHSVNVVRV
jgi:hypothetical protein